MKRGISADQDDPDTNTQPKCFFFTLPAELRDAIYRLCLVEERNFIEISEDMQIPPLLHTNRQIRNEAIEIYVLENEFTADVEDCDMKQLQAFVRNVIEPLGEPVSKQWKVLIGVTPDEWNNWSNLMDWCHAAWEGVLAPERFEFRWPCATGMLEFELIRAAVKITGMAQTSDWKVVRKMLEALKPVADALFVED